MISQLQLEDGKNWEGTWECGLSFSSMDRAAFQAREVGVGETQILLPHPEHLFARGWRTVVFSPQVELSASHFSPDT